MADRVHSKKFLRLLSKHIRAIPDPLERRQQAERTARSFHARNPHFNAPSFLAMCGYPSWTDGTSITVFYPGEPPSQHPSYMTPRTIPVSVLRTNMSTMIHLLKRGRGQGGPWAPYPRHVTIDLNPVISPDHLT